jgi:hypothetical protein
MTDLEARIAKILWDDDESTARQVTQIVTEIDFQVRAAKERQLLHVCRKIKHEFGDAGIADRLWADYCATDLKGARLPNLAGALEGIEREEGTK